HLIPNILRAADGIAPLTVFGDDYPTRDGTCVRDYIHVADLADAHLLALEATDPGDRRTSGSDGGPRALALNLGTGSGFTVREVLRAAERIVGRPVPQEIGSRRPGDPPVLVASAARAREELGWRPARGSLDDMIGSAWAWRQAHPNGYPTA
ncbi:MAG TPA: NAD-dependent epimerase/dehydratase family protein, partial [Candidatus Limnocylindrales bacterium]